MQDSKLLNIILHIKYHKTNPNCGALYIDSLDWIKNKERIINPINKKDNKCFRNAVIVALNYEEIKEDPQRVTKINKYKWEGINFPSEKNDWGKFEKNNVTIHLNFFMLKKKNIYPGYVSKNKSNHEKHVIILMISNG